MNTIKENQINVKSPPKSLDELVGHLHGEYHIIAVDVEFADQSKSSISTQQVITKFLAFKKAANLSDASIRSYGDTLRTFAQHYPQLPIEPEPIEQYLARHHGDNTTAKNIYIVLRLLYKFASERLSLPNPMLKVEKPRGQAKPPEHLTINQALGLLKAIRTDRELGLVYCLLGLGLRLGEVRCLRVGDIHETTILIHGKERIEPMHLIVEIRDALLKLTDGKAPGEPIFSGRNGQPLSDSIIQLIIKNLFARAGIRGVRASPHTLRHSRGVIQNIAGLDSYSSRRLLRHKTTQMTDRYSELNLEELAAKEEKFNPLRVLLGKKPDCA